MPGPLVSVIIPTYNRRTLVVEAIASVLAQTVRDIEVIVIDDGSTDETRQAVAEINDTRIAYFYKPNAGVSAARNTGLAKASGQFICFLDSDDLWPANFLSAMIAAFERNPQADIAYSPRRLHYKDGSTTRAAYWDNCPSGIIREVLFSMSIMQVSSMCFRAKVLEGFTFDERLHNAEDVDAWLRLSDRYYQFVPETEITFRTGHGVATRQFYTYDNCVGLLVLERYYHKRGGNKHFSFLEACAKFSEITQTAAKYHMKKGGKRAAVKLYWRSICYQPWNLYIYRKLLKCLFMDASNDPNPNWKLPTIGD